MTSPAIRELRDDELRREARAFLGKHHSSLATPVPIEHIVESMGLDLIPVATMPVHRGIEGFLSSDLTSICYAPHLSGPGLKDRYHFMLTHEVGHLILHKPLYTGFRTDSEWEAFREELRNHRVPLAEFQAKKFARLVLVPDQLLRGIAVGFVRDKVKAHPELHGIDRTQESFWYWVADHVAAVFHVTHTLAEQRLNDDRLYLTDPLIESSK